MVLEQQQYNINSIATEGYEVWFDTSDISRCMCLHLSAIADIICK